MAAAFVMNAVIFVPHPTARVPFVGDIANQLALFVALQNNGAMSVLVNAYIWLAGLNGPPGTPPLVNAPVGVTIKLVPVAGKE